MGPNRVQQSLLEPQPVMLLNVSPAGKLTTDRRRMLVSPSPLRPTLAACLYLCQYNRIRKSGGGWSAHVHCPFLCRIERFALLSETPWNRPGICLVRHAQGSAEL